tara:strand:- start:365 stop:544 length:180 start_codon:yes stop_codon:yes gene_type:complete
MHFVKKTSSHRNSLGILIKLSIFFIIILGAIFLLNRIDFPAPKKDLEKIIPNENFKIVK